MLADPTDQLVLLDGGTGQELVAHAERERTPLWSAQVMIDEPDTVVAVHRSFLDAGADVITVNAYSATRSRLAAHGREGDFERLQRLAVSLAGEAVAAASGGRDAITIAGCLSPHRWTYRPALAPPFAELWPVYAEAAALQADGVDVVLCETMGSIDEARSAVVGAATTGLPIWVSWSILDDSTARLRSGEPLSDALAAAEAWAADGDADLRAVLLNCSTPEALDAAVPTLTASTLPVGLYANGFHHITDDYDIDSTTNELAPRADLTPVTYADRVERWIDQGVRLVGGCCDIGPAHIAEIRMRVDHRTTS